VRILAPLTLVFLTVSALAQISERPADVIVPIVASNRGQANALFKTSLQLTNPTDRRMTGWLIFHPHAQPAAESDPVLRYDLAPHTTVAYRDIVEAFDTTGFGSLDIFIETGSAPTVLARAFDDQPAGTNGVTVPAVPSSAVLARNDDGALIAPQDVANFRYNVGVRTLVSGASINIITRDAAGVERHRRSADYPASYLEQQPVEVFAGIAPRANDSITIEVTAGSAIIYGTTVDNRTNDASMQVLRR
jgi:hypothetical protein